MPDASQYWQPWEEVASSYEDVQKHIDGIFKDWTGRGRAFAWRGAVNATWPLHSSLYRRLALTKLAKNPSTNPPDEKELRAEEREILANLHRWGLHNGEGGRMSVMAQLAMLQHFGAPTRFLDVTFNPYVGLWFAVEEKFDNGKPKHEGDDARLFAIDVTDRLINEVKDQRGWEDDLECPWGTGREPEGWFGNAFAWRPPHFEKRIAAQNGGFLFGGVPKTGHGQQWKKTTAANSKSWNVDEVRSFISVPLRVHKIDPNAGVLAKQPVYTIRIEAAAKKEIRARLEKLFGYKHSTIYPDYSGFASFGAPLLKTY